MCPWRWTSKVERTFRYISNMSRLLWNTFPYFRFTFVKIDDSDCRSSKGLMRYNDLSKAMIEPGSSHTCASGATGGWRCPVCGAVSPTAGAAQRHMDAHQGVKAFRCTICRYKGNTLRGMRTHIRMHFEKRGTDLQVNFAFFVFEPYVAFLTLSITD